MNIGRINNTNFGAKMPVSRIKLAKDINNKELPVDNYVTEMLSQHGKRIEDVANLLGRDVVITQRKGRVAGKPYNVVYANSGIITTRIDLNAMKNGKELIDGIISNLNSNAAPRL